jgi:hypothetical protein
MLWYPSLRILPFERSHYKNVGDVPFHGLQHRQFLLDVIRIGPNQSVIQYW